MPILGQVPVKLVDAYKAVDAAAYLYALLGARDPVVNISHKKLPTFAQHKRFMRQYPYRFWYLIQLEGKNVGTIYLTRHDEIGVHIAKELQGAGIGTEAIRLLMWKHPRKRFYANIAPSNWTSRFFFSNLGFKYRQATYAYEPN